MQPNNGIIGDASGVDLPQTPVDDTAIKELQAKAKYSRTKEYKDLREKAQLRIDFYKTFLPDGRPVITASKAERAEAWGFANLLIAEFEQLFGENDSADQLLHELHNE